MLIIGKNVVREDVVQISFDVNNSGLLEANNLANSLTNDLTSGVARVENGLDDVNRSIKSIDTNLNDTVDVASNLTKGLDKVTSVADDIELETDDIASGLNKITEEANKTVKSMSKIDTEVSQLDKGMSEVNNSTKTFALKIREIASAGIDKITHPIKTIENAIGSAEKAAAKFVTKLKDIGKTVRKSSEDVDESVSDMNGVFDKFKDIAAGIGVGLGLKSIWDGIVDGTQALNHFQAATGASVEEMKSYGADIKDLYKNGMGGSIGEVSQAMATVKNNGRFVSEEIYDMTNNALLLSDTFDFDVNESIRAVTMMMDQFGISGKDAYNLITQGAQSGLNKNDDLLDTINEYSVHFKQLGFSSDEMFNMLANGVANGTFSVDKLGDAVKEFGIRVKDGSDTTIEGFKLAGLSANDMANKFALGGDNAKQAFMQTISALQQIKDPIKQNIAGVNLFGTMWEDLGVDGVLALGNINGSIASTKNALEDVAKIKYDDAGSALISLARTVNTEFANAATGAVNVIKPVIEFTANNIPTVVSFLGTFAAAWITVKTAIFAAKLAEEGLTIAQWAMNIAMNANPIGLIVVAIGLLVTAFITLWNNCEGFRNFWIGLWDKIKVAFQKFVDFISPAIDGIKNIFSSMPEVIKGFVDKILNVFENIKNGVTDKLSGIKDIFANAFSNAVNYIKTSYNEGALKPLVDKMVSVFGTVKNKIVEKFNGIKSTVQTVMTPILSIVQTIFNGIKNVISTVFGGIKSYIVNTFNNIKTGVMSFINNIKQNFIVFANNIRSAFATIKNGVLTVFNGIKTIVLGVMQFIVGIFTLNIETIKSSINTVKDGFDIVFEGAKQIVFGVWEAIVAKAKFTWSNITSLVRNAINVVKNQISTIKNTVSSVFSSVKNTIFSTFESVKSKISSVFESVKSTISNAISKIKNMFNFEWELPHIKLPHFSITGEFSLNPPSIPTIGVEWYEKGGIMTKPTIFGMNGNNAMVGGEAGAEAVLPLKDFWDNLKDYITMVYTPETDESVVTTNNSTVNETNTYNPIFNLTISGSNDDRAMERKVKQWIKEALAETEEAMQRKQRTVQVF